MLGAVKWEIYPYISMGTTTSMMLLFTMSSRIRRENVGVLSKVSALGGLY